MDVQPHLLNLSAYIDQNLEKDLPLSTLAKRVGLSPFHFHRKFGAYFGESLHQHIKRLRLERAAFALTHGTAPVRQIARDSGYKTVSAFSHAFSGFAGESPTRYRSMAATQGDETTERAGATLEPAWVGDLPPFEFAFVRGMGSEGDVERSVRDALDVMLGLVGPVDARGEGGASGAARNGHAAPVMECLAATSDIYGISRGGDFRVDVGLDAALVPANRIALLGRQTLPGGRYARFDLRCRVGELASDAGGISLRSLQNRGESPRLAQYFVRFNVPDASEDSADYQFFVPLTG